MRSSEPVFVLGDLLAQEDLGLELVSGGPEALELPVAGMHTVEVEHPSRWLDPSWVMLSTGVRLRGRAELQRELIDELERAAVTALGFGVGVVFKNVPSALRDAARERAYPLFSVPYEVPFRELVDRVSRALLSSDLRVYQRLSSVQTYLTDALGTSDPSGTIVARLSELVSATVLVLGPDGSVELSTGEAPADEIWAEIERRPEGLLVCDTDGWHTVATPIPSAAVGPPRWLAVTSPGADFVDRLAKPAARTTAPLLAAIERLEVAARDEERATRAALLDEALEPAESPEQRAFATRAARFGVDLSDPARVVAVLGADELRDELGWRLTEADIPYLATVRGPALVALVQCPIERVRPVLGAMFAEHPEPRAGVGRAARDVRGLPHSLRDAEIAARASGGDEGMRLVEFEELALATYLVGHAPWERIAPKVEELLGPLREHAPLCEALIAYFEHQMDITRTAHALHLHPNSLRYRLGRVEQLIGRSLKEPGTIAAVHLAMVASEWSGDPWPRASGG